MLMARRSLLRKINTEQSVHNYTTDNFEIDGILALEVKTKVNIIVQLVNI